MVVRRQLHLFRREGIITARNEVWGKVIFSEVCVKNSVHGGVCLSACWDTTPRDQAGTPPRTRYPPGPGTPPPQTRHPPEQSMLGDTVNEWVVRILLECILVIKVFKDVQNDFTPNETPQNPNITYRTF